MKTFEPVAVTSAPAFRPEFFRLPKVGQRDPWFGFTRRYFYQGEERGHWQLIRLRSRGRTRGAVMVPYDQVADFIRGKAANGGSE